MSKLSRRTFGLLLGAALLFELILYRSTFWSMVRKWDDDASFVHGYAVVPIVVWLAWRNRERWLRVAIEPSWLGVLAMVFGGLVWSVAQGVGVAAVEQAAAVGIVVATVAAICGLPTARVQLFPLAFLFFAVPFGRAIVPLLMQSTATVATEALRFSGVPVLRTNMFITIPGGAFEVARACSGFNFFITGLFLGVLYAGVFFTTWKKRFACIAAFLIVPIVANAVRVYLTILSSHLTDMRFGPGGEHITFGQVFFLAILAGLIYWVSRWSEREPDIAERTPTVPLASARNSRWNLAAIASVFIAAFAAPAYAQWAKESIRQDIAHVGLLASMATVTGWVGPQPPQGSWRPDYRGAVAERHALYQRADDAAVSVFVAAYALGTSGNSEMISYDNVLFPRDQNRLPEFATVEVHLVSGRQLRLREFTGEHKGLPIVVWTWFVVGDRMETNDYQVKLLEARAFLTRAASSERIVTLATAADDGARARLQEFVRAQGECLASGLVSARCRL